MMSAYMLVLLLVIQVQAQECNIPFLLYGDGCDQYETIPGKWPKVYKLHRGHTETLEECRAKCTARRDCGAFAYADLPPPHCYMFNMNHEVINDALENSVYVNSVINFYGKTCGVDVGTSDLSCNSYRNNAPVNIHVGPRYMWTDWPPYSGVTVEHCKKFCTMYTECKSFTYTNNSAGTHGQCLLHKNTVAELEAAGNTDDIWENTGSYIFTSYDRSCDYEPACPTTTTQAPTTTTEVGPTPSSSGITLMPSVWGMTMTVITIMMPLWKPY